MPKTIMNEKLDFNQALEALEKGLKVKLPEWIGYWFKKYGKILVHSRTGDTLETPFLDDYKNRTDWEITDGNRDFGGAIVALKAGKKVARKGWNGLGMFLYLVPGSTFKVNREPLLSIYTEGTEINYRPHIDLKTADGSVATWSPSGSDALAEDWIIIE